MKKQVPINSTEDYLQIHAVRAPGEGRVSGDQRSMPGDGTTGQNKTKLSTVFREGTVKVVVADGNASSMMQAWSMYRPQIVSIDQWR